MSSILARSLLLNAQHFAPWTAHSKIPLAPIDPVRVFNLAGISKKVTSWNVLGQGDKGIVYQTRNPDTVVKVGSLGSLVEQTAALGVLRRHGFSIPKAKLFADFKAPGMGPLDREGYLQMNKLNMVEGTQLQLRGPFTTEMRMGKFSPLTKDSGPASAEEILFTDVYRQSQPLLGDAMAVLKRHFNTHDLSEHGRNWGVLTEGVERVQKGLPLLRKNLVIYDPIA